MGKFLIFLGQRFPIFVFYLFCIFLILLISGCGGGSDDGLSSEPSETASASFNVAWYDTPVTGASENIMTAAAVDCEAAGVSTITCEVYDGSNTYLTSEVFPCSAGQGEIDNIPSGENREFVILGEDGNGNILYYGNIMGITLIVGQLNDVGTIETRPFYVSALLSPADGLEVSLGDGEFSLNWSPVETAYEYRVQVSEDINFDTPIIDETTIETSYTPSGLLESTTYYWKVFARDIHSNQSVGSATWSFTVISQEPCIYSISPTSRSFPSGGGAGSVSVTTPSGCDWSATEDVGWISITSGSSGSGNGTVTYSVSANKSSNPRSATISIAEISHTVNQDGRGGGDG
jgi:hypothetical protein